MCPRWWAEIDRDSSLQPHQKFSARQAWELSCIYTALCLGCVSNTLFTHWVATADALIAKTVLTVTFPALQLVYYPYVFTCPVFHLYSFGYFIPVVSFLQLNLRVPIFFPSTDYVFDIPDARIDPRIKLRHKKAVGLVKLFFPPLHSPYCLRSSVCWWGHWWPARTCTWRCWWDILCCALCWLWYACSAAQLWLEAKKQKIYIIFTWYADSWVIQSKAQPSPRLSQTYTHAGTKMSLEGTTPLQATGEHLQHLLSHTRTQCGN